MHPITLHIWKNRCKSRKMQILPLRWMLPIISIKMGTILSSNIRWEHIVWILL